MNDITASSPASAASPEMQAFIDFYEGIEPSSLSRLPEIYSTQARFVDPFNDVVGIAAVERIFAHMFNTVSGVRFVITHHAQSGRNGHVVWQMQFKPHRLPKPLQIVGATHLVFDAQGRVELHRDYWDAAHELYAQLPLLGTAVRWLRRQFRTPA